MIIIFLRNSSQKGIETRFMCTRKVKEKCLVVKYDEGIGDKVLESKKSNPFH